MNENNQPEKETEPLPPEYSFNIDEMNLTNKIIDLKQEGNYLTGKTDHGVTFHQRIPNHKILKCVDGKYTLEDMVIAQ